MAKQSLKPVSSKSKGDDTPEWVEYRDKLGRSFGDLVKSRSELHQQKKELEDNIAEYDAKILKAMQQIPAASVLVDGIRATYISQERTSVDRGELSSNMLKLGLQADVVQATIEASTKVTVSEFVRITARKE